MGYRDVKELRTIGECLDTLLRGDLAGVGDMLMQRLKAIQQATKDGNWALAKHLELCDTDNVGLATQQERSEAVQAELQHQKLKGGTSSQHP